MKGNETLDKVKQPDSVIVENLTKLKWELWQKEENTGLTTGERVIFWKINSCLFRDTNGDLVK